MIVLTQSTALCNSQFLVYTFMSAKVKKKTVCCQALLILCICSANMVGVVFANGPEDWGSIPDRVIPKIQKMVLMLPCLTLGIIRYGSWVKWSNTGKVVAPSNTPRCSSYWKRSLRVTLDYGQPTLLIHNFYNSIFSYQQAYPIYHQQSAVTYITYWRRLNFMKVNVFFLFCFFVFVCFFFDMFLCWKKILSLNLRLV